ncbi:MAG: hydrogenase maturation protease [Cyclonatronaceae bacterium]
MTEHRRMLIYGYGNPGRQDDGLGKALVELAEEWVQKEGLENISLDVGYQLFVEDVTLIEDKDLIIFVDASMDECIADFDLAAVEADDKATFTMHQVSPGFILALYETLYGPVPPAYLLQIRGYEWEMEESLSPGAQENLGKAWKELRQILRDPGRLDAPRGRTAISTDKGSENEFDKASGKGFRSDSGSGS